MDEPANILEQWRNRLEKHFKSLAHSRVDSGLHIFALEHGLEDEEINEISLLLRLHLSSGLSPSSPDWLLWVIYATEQGYKYEGDEYWLSFEEETPRWEARHRYQLSHWFTKFQHTYNGVVPSGRWADHFSLISKPITHAILPRYLQIQFARTLYDLRYRLVSLRTLEPAYIGRLLTVNAHHASTRFQQFLQQEALTGRIVLALLGEEPTAGSEPIYPPTLQRIVEDLERVRNTREWLKETRHIVKDRFKGIGRALFRPTSHTPRGDPQHQDAIQYGVRPSIMLGYRGGDTWSVWLEVPSFRNVATLDGNIQTFLRRTRCHLNGASDVKPAGWLLSGNRKGALKSWPDPEKPLVTFEQPHGRVENILETECRLNAGPVWLFRIAADGTAREIAGRIVRPNSSYIVATTGMLPNQHSGMTACHIDCAGINAFRLQIPSEVSAEDTAWLGELDLQMARTIQVWPAGLPGRGWDGEGHSEWLTTEAPCFGIRHDHPVDAYILSLDNDTETKIQTSERDDPIFVRLAPLPAGKYTLTVKAQRSSSLDSIVLTPAAEGFIDLQVREPEPWISGIAFHSGLIATLDPHDANLDTFWRNETRLSVLGPESRSVRLVVSLKNRNGDEILSEQIGGPMTLPILPDTWRKMFARFLENEQNTWRYLEAISGQLDINGEELGKFSFQFEHEIIPLRWVMQRGGDDVIARLIDDTGLEGSAPEVLFFSMNRPLKAEQRPSATTLSGMPINPPGGLVRASQGDCRDVVVISTGLTTSSFQDLGIASDFTEIRNNSIALADSLRLYADWYNARQFGPLVGIRRDQIVEGLLNIIYEKLCGRQWARAEVEFCNARDSVNAIDNFIRHVQKPYTGFSSMLRQQYGQIVDNLTEMSKWYSELAARFHVSTDRKLSDFTFRLSTEAHLLPFMFGSELDVLLDAVRDNPTVLRGARFLACVIQSDTHPSALPAELKP